MLVVKSSLDQRIKALLMQEDFGRTTIPLDATTQINNVSAVISKPYDPDTIPPKIGRTWINTLTGEQWTSTGTGSITDRELTGGVTTPDLVGWTTDIVWSASDNDTVAWTSGNIKLADGTSYSVNSGNTGNMTAITYIYYNGTSTLQTTTTPQNAVGAGKIMVCVAKNETSPKRATFQAFGTLGQGILITADNIAANTITANEIASNTITATQISSSYVYAGDISADQITAGTITGRTLQTGTSGQRVVIDATNNRVQFYNSDGDDCGYIRGVTALSLDLMQISKPIRVEGGGIFQGAVFPYSDATYDLGTSSYQWRDLYVKDDIEIDGYTLDEASGYLRWRSNYVPYITGSGATQTATAALKIMVNGSEYWVNVRAV